LYAEETLTVTFARIFLNFIKMTTMRSYFMLFVLASLLAQACDGSKKEIDALDKQTKEIHDQAMGDLAAMNQTSLALKDFMIKALMTPEQSTVFNKTLADMEKAESDMMEWMAQDKLPEGKSKEEALAFMKERLAKITRNRDDIRAATEAGKKLLPQQ